MKYEETYLLIQAYTKLLVDYAIKNDQVNRNYYKAQIWLSDISKKCYSDEKYRILVSEWITKGSTLKLKKVLKAVNYCDSDLIQFNAFCLMDAVNVKIN